MEKPIKDYLNHIHVIRKGKCTICDTDIGTILVLEEESVEGSDN